VGLVSLHGGSGGLGIVVGDEDFVYSLTTFITLIP